MPADIDRDLALGDAEATQYAQETAEEPGAHLDDADPRNFSIILGGPLFQLLRRAHMTGDALELVRRRVLVIAAIGWLPLFALALARGDALGGSVAVPFLKDFEVHVRFLVAMPLLIVAELVVHLRLRPVAREFLVRSLIPANETSRFHAALASAMRLRNSVVAELVMVGLVYALGVPAWRELSAVDVPTWYAQDNRFTWAGLWYAYISVPMFQFLLLRWYFRILVWARFLWHVSRLKLQVSAMHADRMGGLAFLSTTTFAFVPLAMAHGAVLSGSIATRIFHAGGQLADAKVEIAVVVGFLLLIVLIPLTFFAPQVAATKRLGARIYGRLGQRYVVEFEDKWLPSGRRVDETLLGTADIQSLADLSNSFETLRSTRVVPITRQAVMTLAVATLVPIAPLLLTVIPAEELAKQLLKLLM